MNVVGELVRKQDRDLLHLSATRSSVVHVDVGVILLGPTVLLERFHEQVAMPMFWAAKIP